MDYKKESKWKVVLDNILIYNLYLLIIGAIFLSTGFILSINGNANISTLFQRLWYPIFIPSFSLFFTAILIEFIINNIKNGDKE
tara:strand:+ start:412 stop:663 length:252 start_codon:yes stop_codon:yes gene_type:complete